MICKRMWIALLSACACLQAEAQVGRIQIDYYDGTRLSDSKDVALRSGRLSDGRNHEWEIRVDSVVDKSRGWVDYTVACRLLSGAASQVAVGIDFGFDNWSADNFVFVPAIVYDGNRFEKKAIGYPPYWYEPQEWRKDMPTTTPLLPSLEKHENYGRIELTTGNASTPLMAFFSPAEKRVWMVQTLQGNRWGNYGLFIEEDKKEGRAAFTLQSPAVREKRALIGGFAPSGDRAADLKAGDAVDFRFRIYRRPAKALRDLYALFMEVRQDLNPVQSDYAVMPYSEIWRVMNELFQQNRWNESIQMYSLTRPGSNSGWNQIWQLGWVGGGQVTLPFLLRGDSMAVDRSMRNLNSIFERTQAPSGFYYAYGNGHEFKGFGYGRALSHDETFVRSQGDFLYMAQLQFAQLKRRGHEVPAGWKASLRRQADAFLRLWERYGQVGQFVNVETGELCIGNSVAGGIVPAGLALASSTFSDRRYLAAAEGLAEKFYRDYVMKGYTTGGPGEILSSPDSESAFALFESFVVLHEVTGRRKWLDYAADLLPICASWVVSYDFRFPSRSEMQRLGVHSTGAVWASVANKHGAPAICTWSGESLLKYFRATGDEAAVRLLRDIAHGVPQYISHSDRPIAGMEPGGACERVNLSDWEGKNSVGGNLFASCSWVEAATLLTVTQLPGIYVQKDRGLVAVFDHLKVKVLEQRRNRIRLQITNPTAYDAEALLYVETARQARKEPFSLSRPDRRKCISVKAGESVEVTV